MNHYTIKLTHFLAIFAMSLMFYTFYNKHFVTPTINLVSAIMLYNWSIYGFQRAPWLRTLPFYFFLVMSVHAYFALFWAKTPRAMLGNDFTTAYAVVCGVFALLAYTQKHKLKVDKRAEYVTCPTPARQRKY